MSDKDGNAHQSKLERESKICVRRNREKEKGATIKLLLDLTEVKVLWAAKSQVHIRGEADSYIVQ